MKRTSGFLLILALLLPGVVTAAADSSQVTPLEALGRLVGKSTGDNELLPVDKAYQFDAEALSADRLVLRWRVTDGYYLYRNKLKVRLPDNPGSTPGALQLPAGEHHEDEFFGPTEIYRHDFEAQLPLTHAGTAPQRLMLEIGYQGCAEIGVCYPPVTKRVTLTLPATSAGTALPEQDRIAAALMSEHVGVTLLAFFGFGLLLAFTPCVFPMVPILSGLIVGQGREITTGRAFVLSLAYVLAMAVTYTAAGVVAGLFGANLQAGFQNPWVLGAFSSVFVLLALALFGFYDLQAPSWLQGKVTELSNRQRGGTVVGAAVMGLLSALIVGPCLAAPLAGALIYIGRTGDAVLGGSALFMLSLGMGAPLLVFGTTAGKLLPKAGPWMNTVKAVFGVLLLGVAIWMLERILPAAVTLTLWAALLIVSGVYMGALERLQPDASGWRKLWKGAGLVIVIYGALLLVGAAGGGRDVLQPLTGLSLPGTRAVASSNPTLPFQRIKSVAEFQRAAADAKAQGKAVMLDFYADWCVSCKEMEKYTFADPGVRAALADSVLLQANVTANDAQDQELLRHFGLIGPPSILFFSPEGDECTSRRVMGYLDPEQFRAVVTQATC